MDENFGSFTTGFSQWLLQAIPKDHVCEEVVPLLRKDGTVFNLHVHVNRGFCPKIACAEGTIKNLDLTSTTACECQPMPHEGMLIDLSKDQRKAFAFDLKVKFTLREWTKSTSAGDYEWSNLEEPKFKCLTKIGEFDEGRYRQVSFEATKAECTDSIVRFQSVKEGAVT